MADEYIEPVRLPRWPTQCAVCHGWGWSRLCARCVAVHAPRRHRCAHCALQVPEAVRVCGRCLLRPPTFDVALAAVDYAPPWDGVLARYKFHAGLDLRDALADLLIDAQAAAGLPRPDLLLPVPLSPERLRERGYNQAWELVRRIARRLPAQAAPDWLLRIRHTPQQMALPLAERSANVRGAFAVDPLRLAELRGRDVTVVDDVMTTGATFEEISRVLRAAGVGRVQVWALARTPAPDD